jgi:Na+-transporting NADH:ubiquinone oxidoreductase subunit A
MKNYKIKRGLDIKLKGKAVLEIDSQFIDDKIFVVSTENLFGFEPKLDVEENDAIKRGQAVIHDKNFPEIKLVSPVCGVVKEIIRGEKRKIKHVVIEKAEKDGFIYFDDYQYVMKIKDIKDLLLSSGCWLYFKQRPYGTIVNPTKEPSAIFISFFDSAPLAPDFDIILKDKIPELNKALEILSDFYVCNIYLNFKKGSTLLEQLTITDNFIISTFEGPHPAGLSGTHINKIRPISKHDILWTISASDLAIIGTVFLRGEYSAERTIAVCGSEVKQPCYYKTTAGIYLGNFLRDKIKSNNVRIISGNVLTGTNVSKTPYLGHFDTQVTVIPEGNTQDDLFGWLMPGLDKLSTSKTFLSNYYPLLNFLKSAGNDTDRLTEEYTANTNTHGGQRAFIMSGEYENVCPLDLFPQMLIKAIIANDIEKIEQLGIYDVIPEDLALCEFVCTSKLNVQAIIQNGIKMMIGSS